MAHEKPQHDYHLVEPSYWPLLASLSVLLISLGFTWYINDGSIVLFVIGSILLSYVLISWFKDIVVEGNDGHHTTVVKLGMRYGVVMFILSEVMFFVAWFWVFFNASLFFDTPMHEARTLFFGGVWPPKNIETFDPLHLPLLNTLLLLLSGTTVTWAHHALIHNDRKGLKQGLWVTVILGLVFSVVQGIEYSHAQFPFGGDGGLYSSIFFMATGFHGIHVFIGTIFLGVCLLRGVLWSLY